ncbi:hypothetical protein BDV93DRAFT_512986 [Ceratobasidium sp. AG-I]|nr:hypothetical protein BDV93DRAFT_512986 [Ceratobasidium sp. AG-I]
MGATRRSRKLPAVDYRALSGRKSRSSTSARPSQPRKSSKGKAKASSATAIAEDTEMTDLTVAQPPFFAPAGPSDLCPTGESDYLRHFRFLVEQHPSMPPEASAFLFELVQRNPEFPYLFYAKPAKNDTMLDEIALHERLRLASLPENPGLFGFTADKTPTRRAGGAAMLSRMHTQKTQHGVVFGGSGAKGSKPKGLLPAATIIEPPRSGGPLVSRFPTATEAARRQHSSVRKSEIISISDSDSDSGSKVEVLATDDSEPIPHPCIRTLDMDLQPTVTTACEIYRILVLTASAFPNAVEKASFQRESMRQAWRVHDCDGEPPEVDLAIAAILNQRPSQIRGELKTIARGFVGTAYGLNGLSRTAREKKFGNGSGRKFMNASITELLIRSQFSSGRTSPGRRFLHLFSPISSNLLAILIVSIAVALREQANNMRVNIDFKESEFKPLFDRVKMTIDGYHASRRPRSDEVRSAILDSCRCYKRRSFPLCTRLACGDFEDVLDQTLALHMSP